MTSVVDWGVREYRASLAAMRARVRARQASGVADTLVLVEHPSVVTVGVEGDDGGAEASGFPVVRVERGGRATYHGPGQLVGYPIVDLEARGRDVRRFVHDVEELVVRAAEPFGVHAGRASGRRGVWVDGSRKLASVGIAVDHWVTFHGFALNVAPDLGAFERIRPCGFDGSVMTSLARETGRSVALEEVKPEVVRAWGELFGADGDPERSTARTPPVGPAAPS